MYSLPYLEPVCCSMPSSNYCFLTCIQISQKTGQVVRYSHFFKSFHSLLWSTQSKALAFVNQAENIYDPIFINMSKLKDIFMNIFLLVFKRITNLHYSSPFKLVSPFIYVTPNITKWWNTHCICIWKKPFRSCVTCIHFPPLNSKCSCLPTASRTEMETYLEAESPSLASF